MSYRLDYGKRAAKCKGPLPCKGTPIVKGTLRCATAVSINGNTAFQYRHWGCVTEKVLENLKASFDTADEIDGFEDIEPVDQEKVRKAFQDGHVADEDIPDSARKPDPPSGEEEEEQEKPKKKKAAPKRKKKAESEDEQEGEGEDDEDFKPKKKAPAKKKAPPKKKAKKEESEEEPEAVSSEEEKPKKKQKKTAAKPKAKAKKAKKEESDDDNDSEE